MLDVLTSHTWYRAGTDPSSASGARYAFRPDGCGRYEPATRHDLPPAERAERSKAQEFRYEVTAGTLRLKFALARDWFETPLKLEPGPRRYSQDARFARHLLVFARDPYAFVIAGTPEADSAWESDAGAGLPG